MTSAGTWSMSTIMLWQDYQGPHDQKLLPTIHSYDSCMSGDSIIHSDDGCMSADSTSHCEDAAWV